VVRIIITADKDPDTAVRSINESEVYRFIRKPWNDSDLRTIMHFAFEVVRLEREKRRLLSMVRDERAARLLNGSPEDPVGIESELLLLAEDELHGS
jgi:DNA-binding NtrC family response regulator